MLYSMKQEDIPKGVIWSTALMSTPLFALTMYLATIAPGAANAAFCNPESFAYFARTAVRLLSLNIAFMGGIHYGFAAATYETAITPEEKARIKYQMVYSFMPATFSFLASSTLLFASPLTLPTVVWGFTSLMVT